MKAGLNNARDVLFDLPFLSLGCAMLRYTIQEYIHQGVNPLDRFRLENLSSTKGQSRPRRSI
jgi:hypothetical protein